MNALNVSSFIWGIADDVLRDVYVRGKYRDVILPMTVIRRLDAVLEPTILKGEGVEADNMQYGSTLSNDAFPALEFDFMLSNPPYGKSWKADLERLGGRSGVSESAAPVIKKIHRKGVAPAPPHGLFQATIGGQPAVVEYEPDPDLRDTEQVPLLHEGGIAGFLRREALPYAPDAWYDPDSVKVGYEISFTRHFYQPQPLRPPEKIRSDIIALERETEGLLGEIVG